MSKEQRNYLLIGGQGDGQWVALPEPMQQYLHGTIQAWMGQPGRTVAVEYQTYHLETLRATEDYLVYRHESLSVDDVLRRLMQHYKPQ